MIKIQWLCKTATCKLHWKTNHVSVKFEQSHESSMEGDDRHSPNGRIHMKDDNIHTDYNSEAILSICLSIKPA